MDFNRYRKPVKQTLKTKKYRGVRSYRKKSGAKIGKVLTLLPIAD